MKILFATHNDHKSKEVRKLIPDLITLSDLGDQDEIEELGITFEENALIKAREGYRRYKMPTIADDSGLEITALNNAPSVYSARYAGDHDSNSNINKVLRELEGKTDRSARFRTVVAFVDGINEYIFEGVINGSITESRRGNSSFGYEPIFLPNGWDITFAEMSTDIKNKISHRAKAFKKFMKFYEEYTSSY